MEKKIAIGNFFILVLTFSLTLSATIGGCYKFTAYESVLASIDAEIKAKEQRLKAAEVRRVETANLEIEPRLYSHSEFFGLARDHGRMRYVMLTVTYKNIGLAPIHLGTMHLRVEQSAPGLDLAEKLRRYRDKEIELVSGPPRVTSSTPGSSEFVNRKPEPQGMLFSANATDFEWAPIPSLSKNVSIDYTLLPEQRVLFDFSYILEESQNPKWYRLIGRASPSKNQNKQWEARSFDVVFDSGPFPPRPRASGSVVQERVVQVCSDRETSASDGIPRIPYDKIKVEPADKVP